ncbi:MAG: glycosyltransferase family 2 protein [Candidatus Falkowbacteria bacterium]
MSKVAVIISPNWRDYGRKYLPDCLASVRAQRYAGEIKLFLIDNESTPESLGFLKSLAPEAEIIVHKKNTGFAEAHNPAMARAIESGCKYVILFNIDTIVEPEAVSEMVKTADQNEQIGAVQARLMLWPDKTKINSLGNCTHFLGFGYCAGYRDEISSHSLQNGSKIFYPSGAAVLFRADVLMQVGLFDEVYWMYAEDQDIAWRIWLAGYSCVLAADAVVFHKYEFSRSTKKYYWMDRNRIITIIKNYHWLTLLIIFPALVLMEFGLLFFSLTNGWFGQKLALYAYFLRPKTWQYLVYARQKTQSLRKVPDKAIISLISTSIGYQEIDSWSNRLANWFFTLYWSIIKPLIRW